MSCNSCSTKDKKGCNSGGGCSSGSCGTGKLAVFDWLANTQLLGGQEKFDCVEVRFKNSRKEYFKNTEKLSLQIGDVVATEASSGHDVGVITLTGELVRLQMKKHKINWESDNVPKIYRKANQRDIDIWQESRAKENAVQKQSRELAIALGLEMKISDVEFQGDGSKATFYYTAEGRVDFRQLIKDMARVFSVRIEMRQIGFRQEAARLGGIGSCGRELCCSTWLTDFRTVTTAAARYQQLSLNPQKLAGQCGKLKCCINFELDMYLDALQDFPKTDIKLLTEKGKASCQKIDIFKRLMWFTYDEDPINWYKISVDNVKKIISLNEKEQKVVSLDDYAIVSDSVGMSATATISSDIKEITEEDITRFDKPKQKKNKKKNQNQQKNNVQKNTNSSKNQQKENQHNKAPKESKSNPNPNPNVKKENIQNLKPLKEPKKTNFKRKPNHNRNNPNKET
ncbi:MAG: regulatory iron-sulfur-containing complex subunit RicT [Capnocytophaga sp.]|nr:regulatory iron-sulfur-containing complex subunit RicT [Capnocytophaga sp.]